MRKLIHNFLICIAIVAAALIIGLLMRPYIPDFTVSEPQLTEKIEPVIQIEKNITEEVDNKKVVNSETDEKFANVEKKQESVNVEKKVETPSLPLIEKKEVKVVEKKSEIRKNTENLPPEKSEKTPEINIVPEKKLVKKTVVSSEKNVVKEQKQPIKKIVERKQIIMPHWLEDFEPDGHINGEKFVDDWRHEGGVLFTPKTRFFLRHDANASMNSVLVIESKKSSAVFACDLSGKINLNETPVLRWRWRVRKLSPNADGRHRKKDDQAVGIYIGTGTAFNQKAIAYRWETETPVGHWGKTVYSNVMSVRFLCCRNKDDGLDVWFEDERNVRDDFMEKFGFVPKNIALVICGNSQNSKSDALAEIDYIGFYKKGKDSK